MEKMLLDVLVLLSNLGIAFLQPDRGWSNYHPMQSIALEMPDLNQPSVWNELRELDSEQAGAMVTHLKNNLQQFREQNSYILAKGSHVMSRHSIAGITLEDFYELPFGNVLALLGFNLRIILEGFRPAVLYQPMIKSLKGKDQSNPNLPDRKEKSLWDLLTSLPSPGKDQIVEDSELVLDGLASYGKEAFSFANILLGKDRNEAWLDSFYALSIEESPLASSGRVAMRWRNMISYSLAVIHELNRPKSSFPQTDHQDIHQFYMYGWWMNCPKSLDSCLWPLLPRDLIVSASTDLRIYIVPSLELTLVVHNKHDMNMRTLKDLLKSDQKIWVEMHSFLQNTRESSEQIDSEELASGDGRDRTADESKDSDSLLIHYIHKVWPVLVFVFWVVSSHVWVYWMFHCCWLLATSVSKRTHIPRPKSGAGN